jgi:hypothetical protein
MICFSTFQTKSKYVKCCGKVCSRKLQQLTKYGVKEEKPITSCETCGITPEKKYSTGRFCSKKCACSFSTSHAREKISEKASQTLKNKYHKDEATPCEKCGIVPETKHESGRWCIDCAYLVTQNMIQKRLKKSKKIEVKEKVPKKKGPEVGKFLSEQRKIWETGEKKNVCENCLNSFNIVWKEKNKKFCSKQCVNNALSKKMIDHIIKNGCNRTFGKHVIYTNNNQHIRCDSLIEWCALEHLFEKYNDQIIEIKRSNVRIQYENDLGNKKTYIPDFDVTLKSGEIYCVECKSEHFGLNNVWIQYKKDSDLKYHLLKEYCSLHNKNFLWFTQKTRYDLYKKCRKLFAL